MDIDLYAEMRSGSDESSQSKLIHFFASLNSRLESNDEEEEY